VVLIDHKLKAIRDRRSHSTAEHAKPINRSLTLHGTIKRLLRAISKSPIDQQNRYAQRQTTENSPIPAASLRTWRCPHDPDARNCRAEFIQSISFRKKRIRDLEAVLSNYPIDHGFIDFIEELNAIAFRAYRSNTTLCFEEFGVDEHRFV
jgi:hypothetical protein